jgi:hypothetical protein
MKLFQKVVKVSFKPRGGIISSLSSKLEPRFSFHVEVLLLLAAINVAAVELVALYNIDSPLRFFFVRLSNLRHVYYLL